MFTESSNGFDVGPKYLSPPCSVSRVSGFKVAIDTCPCLRSPSPTRVLRDASVGEVDTPAWGLEKADRGPNERHEGERNEEAVATRVAPLRAKAADFTMVYSVQGSEVKWSRVEFCTQAVCSRLVS